MKKVLLMIVALVLLFGCSENKKETNNVIAKKTGTKSDVKNQSIQEEPPPPELTSGEKAVIAREKDSTVCLTKITEMGEQSALLKENINKKYISKEPAEHVEFLERLQEQYRDFSKYEPKEPDFAKGYGKALKTYEKQLKKFLRSQYKIARTKYINKLSHKLWENNITVEGIGKNKKAIKFIGGIFANNKNKKDFYDAANEMWSDLRFSRVQFFWIRSASRYTEYNLSARNDDDIKKYF